MNKEDRLLLGDNDWVRHEKTCVPFYPLNEPEETQLVEEIRKNSMTGRPCGSGSFIGGIEEMVGRRLRALPWGRPRKNS